MLASLANIKLFLGITDNSKDSLLTLLGTAVSKQIETYTGRTFESTVYTNEEYDGNGTRELKLKHFPVVTFTKLERNNAEDNTDDWTELDSSDYWVDTNSGVVSRVSGFLDYEPTAENDLSNESLFTWGKNRYRATYTAGYATVPEDVQLVTMLSVSNLFKTGKNPNLKSESLGDHSITFKDSLGLDDYSKSILDSYREPVLSD
jgi:hypothetical protein